MVIKGLFLFLADYQLGEACWVCVMSFEISFFMSVIECEVTQGTKKIFLNIFPRAFKTLTWLMDQIRSDKGRHKVGRDTSKGESLVYRCLPRTSSQSWTRRRLKVHFELSLLTS